MSKRDYGECLCFLCIWAFSDVSCHVSYRFRLVSISCDPSFTFSIDGHQMTIIEVEGTNVKPLTVDSIPIFVGTFASCRLSCCTNRCLNRSTLLCCRKKISVKCSHRRVGLIFL